MAKMRYKMNSKQHGGEGTESYAGTKPRMTGEGKQHGGEGSMISTKKGPKNPNMGMSGEQYCGPGRYIAPSA